eukprot:COSAG02_NODE_1174_length_14082_cov_1929.950154_5_plen_50_part_00
MRPPRVGRNATATAQALGFDVLWSFVEHGIVWNYSASMQVYRSLRLISL